MRLEFFATMASLLACPPLALAITCPPPPFSPPPSSEDLCFSELWKPFSRPELKTDWGSVDGETYGKTAEEGAGKPCLFWIVTGGRGGMRVVVVAVVDWEEEEEETGGGEFSWLAPGWLMSGT